MTGTIRAQDFEMESFYSGPGTCGGNRLRHLPTGMQWELPGRPDLTVQRKVRQLFEGATRDLIAQGWEPDEAWQRRMAQFAEGSGIG